MAQVSIRITGVPFDQIAPKIQKGLDLALAKTLTDQQAALITDCPKDTGRMASSFQIGQNSQPTADRGDSWDSGGEGIVWEYDGKITFSGTWFLSNNVPYAEYVALAYKSNSTKAVRKDWYTSIVNQTANVFASNYSKLKL